METLSAKDQGILFGYMQELKDVAKQCEVEVSSCDNPTAKASLIETRLKAIVATINLDKQRRNILPKQMI